MTKTAIGIIRPLFSILNILEPDRCDGIYHFTIDELMQVTLKRYKQFVDEILDCDVLFYLRFLIGVPQFEFYRIAIFDEEQR